MKLALFVPCLLIATVACTNKAKADATPTADVAFHRTPGGQVAVQARVNDAAEPLWFIVDSGSSASSLSAATVTQLGLIFDQTGETTVGAANIERDSPETHLSSLQVGDVVLHDVSVSQESLNERAGRGDDITIAGVLGQDVLARFDVDVDFVHGHVRLWPRGTGKEHVQGYSRAPFTVMPSGLLAVKAALQDGASLPISAVVDIGASKTIVNNAAAKTAPTIEDAASKWMPRAQRAVGADGVAVRVQPRRFAHVAIGDARFDAHTVLVGDLPVFATLGIGENDAGMIVGLDLLGGRDVVFDYADSALFLGPSI